MFARALPWLTVFLLLAAPCAFANGPRLCDDEGDDEDVCAPPKTYLRLEAMALKRADNAERPLALAIPAVRPGPSQSEIDTGDFDQAFEPGGRLTAGVNLNSHWSLEVAGEWVQETSGEVKSISGAGGQFTPFAVDPGIGTILFPTGFAAQNGTPFTTNQAIRANYDSQVWSAEADVIYHWGEQRPVRGTLGVGLRTFELDEGLKFRDTDVIGLTGNFLLEDELYNRLIGVHGIVGFEAHPMRCLTLDAEARGGIFANWLGDRAALIGNATTGAEETHVEVGVATLVEATGGGRWDITPRISFTFGYRLMVAGGVGLAVENLQTNLSDPSEYMNPRHDGSTYWHGPFAGLEIRF